MAIVGVPLWSSSFSSSVSDGYSVLFDDSDGHASPALMFSSLRAGCSQSMRDPYLNVNPAVIKLGHQHPRGLCKRDETHMSPCINPLDQQQRKRNPIFPLTTFPIFPCYPSPRTVSPAYIATDSPRPSTCLPNSFNAHLFDTCIHTKAATLLRTPVGD